MQKSRIYIVDGKTKFHFRGNFEDRDSVTNILDDQAQPQN